MPLKYALPLLFICALVLSATTGCTDSNPTATPSAQATVAAAATAKPTATTTATKTPTATPTPGVIEEDGMQFSAKPVANTPQAFGTGGWDTPDAGKVYVAFDCTVKNVGVGGLFSNDRIGNSYWQLRDKAGNVYDPEIIIAGDTGIKLFESVDSKPGDIVSGYVIFEVPANHGAWKNISYDDGGRDVVINL